MAYPEKGAKYAGESRVGKICRAEGGAVPLPRSRPDIEGAARAELGRRLKDTDTFKLPDNQRNMRMPYQQDEEAAERMRKARMTETDI